MLWLFGFVVFFAKEQKRAIWCLKHKSLNINLFIELLYKTNITFVITLIFEEKTSLHVILNYMKLYKYIHFLPPYLEFCDLS